MSIKGFKTEEGNDDGISISVEDLQKESNELLKNIDNQVRKFVKKTNLIPVINTVTSGYCGYGNSCALNFTLLISDYKTTLYTCEDEKKEDKEML